MIVNYEIGKIFDSIFYGIMYFHKQVVIDKIKTRLFDASIVETAYQEAFDELPPLPSVLSPFFCPQKAGRSALTLFFQDQIDFEHDTIDTFLRKISVKPSLLYAKVLCSLFPEFNSDEKNLLPVSDPEVYFEMINNASYPPEFKLQVALLFGNYQHALTQLIEYLQLIYTTISAIHKKHEDEILAISEHIHSDKCSEILRQLCNQLCAKEFDFSHSYFTVSWIHPYILDFVTNGDYFTIIVGTGFDEVIHATIEGTNINLQSILLALGNETRLSILRIVAETGEMTVTNIAKALQLPSSTAFFHVDILSSKNILCISRKKKSQIFYNINFNILRNANKFVSDLITKYTGGNQNA